MHRVESAGGDDRSIELQIQAKGLTAPRITPADLEAVIASEHFFTAGEGVDGADIAALRAKEPEQSLYIQPLLAEGVSPHIRSPLGLLTFCVLVLKNGFTVTGESACASPENFDADIGKKVARENAKQKLWPLLGYNLKEQLFNKEIPHAE